MKKELKCIRCGTTKYVFMDSVFDHETNEIELFPMCINCAKKALYFKNQTQWKNELKNLELNISRQLIDDKFAHLKFKKSAQNKLVSLMGKYSIRHVFDICSTLSNGNFNLNNIRNKCRQKTEL